MLFLSIYPVLLHYVVVVVRSFEGGLHLGELVLHAVELHTSLLSVLLDLAHFLFLRHGGVICERGLPSL